jgi:hypothetical protein
MTDRNSTDDIRVLQAEIARQRARLQRLEDALREVTEAGSARTVSRRGLLAGAAGLVGAGIASVATAQPAAADDGDPLLCGDPNTATAATTLSAGLDDDPAFDVTNTSDVGTAVHAKGFTAIYGEAGDEYGTGVLGYSKRDAGVSGQTNFGVGVAGSAFHGVGVGASSSREYGIVTSGGRAPIRLLPSDTVGAPAHGKHKTGELYVDKDGSLYFCVQMGHPGTWVRLAHR